MPDFGIPNIDLLTLLRGRQPVMPASAVGSALGRSQTMAASPDPALNPDENTRIGVNADNRFAATERGMERSGTAGQARDPNDPMPIASGNMSSLAPQPGGGAISGLMNSLRAAPPVAPRLPQLTAQMPAAVGRPNRELPGPGFIPGQLSLNPAIAPNVPPGAPRPFAPGERIHNPDGSWSSEVSMTVSGDKSFNNGEPTIIPSLWIKDGLAYVAKDEGEATDLAKASGLNWPTYPSLEAAEAAAQLREHIWDMVGNNGSHLISPLWTPPAPSATIEPPPAPGGTVTPLAPRAPVVPAARPPGPAAQPEYIEPPGAS